MMRVDFENPWERYALISELARRFDAEHIRIGKTPLQKVIFLLQRVFRVDCDYAYTLYTYGPYCAEVARDIDIVEGLGGVVINYDDRLGAFEIRPGPANEELRKRGATFLQRVAGALQQLLLDYGRASAKDIDLRSTIVFISKDDRNKQEIVRRVHEVKLHFSIAQIETALHELEIQGYVGNGFAASQTLTATS
ncbi:MAG TPA: hypothetical protein VHU83_23510 [Bryobacteraceae bacterium]|jgi:hypothetical protein|nr:hypothetical protein [Bryobacteraceae bacterium]